MAHGSEDQQLNFSVKSATLYMIFSTALIIIFVSYLSWKLYATPTTLTTLTTETIIIPHWGFLMTVIILSFLNGVLLITSVAKEYEKPHDNNTYATTPSPIQNSIN